MIKDLVVSRECLTVIDHNNMGDNHIFVHCDASDWRTGVTLSYGPTRETARPVAFDSMQLKGAELNYPVHEKELLAIIWACKKWRVDLIGMPFTVYTDHRTLENFKQQKDLSRRQARWQEFLGQYDFEIIYLPGEENTAADALSRLPPDEEGLSEYTHTSISSLHISTDPVWLQKIRDGYKSDPWCKKLRDAGTMVGYREENGLMYVGDRLIIPRSKDLRENLFHLAHDSLGHFGFEKSYATLRSAYYWPRMRAELKQLYVPSCDACQRNKNTTSKPHGPLHPLPVPDRRGDSVAIDFVGPLPEDDGKTCIVTMTDRLGADIRIVATRHDITAEEFAALFFKHWYCKNGLPSHIVSDQDKLFMSRFWQALHRLTGIKLKMSSSYYSEIDGALERSNKTVVQLLRYHVARNQKGWARALPQVRFDIMNTVNTSTGFTPFQLHPGRSPRLITPLFDADILETERQLGDTAQLAAEMLKHLETDVMEAQDNLQLAKMHQATYANRSRSDEIVYKVGDQVLLFTLHRRREYMQRGDHRAAKFMIRYDGPFTISAAHPEASVYKLDLPPTMKLFPSFHASLLRPYNTNDGRLFPGREHEKPGLIVGVDGEEEWPVEKLLDKQRHGRGWRYLVRWKGYGPDTDSWIPDAEAMELSAYDDWLRENEPQGIGRPQPPGK